VCEEDKPKADNQENCGFGVMGEILRNLQREEEEFEQTVTCLKEVTEINKKQDQIEILKEISMNLKVIAETQKSILKELRKRNSIN
jgi:hypothetical protein